MFNVRVLVSVVAFAVMAQAASVNEIVPPRETSRPFSLGLVGGYVDKPYSAPDDDAKRVVAPLILWEGERFFWRGASGGYKFANRPDFEVAALASFRATIPAIRIGCAVRMIGTAPSMAAFVSSGSPATLV